MPRAPIPPRQQSDGIPLGILPSKIVGVKVTDNDDDFPKFLKTQGYDLVYEFSVQAESHKYPTQLTFPLRLDVDETGSIITYEDEGVDFKDQRGIQALWYFFDAIGYKGALDPQGNFISHADHKISIDKVPDDILDYLSGLDEYPILLNFYKKDSSDGRAYVSVSRMAMPNTMDGMAIMRKTFKPKALPADKPKPATHKPGRPPKL